MSGRVRSHLKSCLGLCVAFGFLTADGGAATYYVRETGSDANAGTSRTAAFATIARAAQVARNGDQVYVGAGRYSESVSIRGILENGSPLQFTADTEGVETGDAGNVVLVNPGGLTVTSSHHVYWTGFRFRGDVDVTWTGCTDARMEKCRFASNANPIRVNQSGVLFNECEVVYSAGDGISIDAANQTVTIRNCRITGCSSKGVRLTQAAACYIEDCVISNNGSDAIYGLATSSSQWLYVSRVAVLGNGRDGMHLHSPLNVRVVSSLCAENRQHGIYNHGSSRPVSIFNCTLARNGGSGAVQEGSGTMTVTSCAIAYNDNYGLTRTSGTLSRSYNLYYNNSWGNGSGGTGDMVANPRFVGFSDYHLSSGSPAIDRGTDAGVDLDLDGAQRIAGARVDMGAYEYGAVPPNFYVRVTGDDNNTGRTAAAAWRTIGKAASSVTPGSTVYVGAGVYRESINFAAVATATDPTIFEADTTGARTGDAGAVVVTAMAPGWWAWNINTSQSVLIRGFSFTDSGVSNAYGVQVNQSTGVLFDSCRFQQIGKGLSATASDVTVSGCTFQNNLERSLSSSAGQLVVRDSTFQQNALGPYSDHDTSLRIENCSLTQQTDWAAVVVGPRASLSTLGPTMAWFVDTTIDNNQKGVKFDNITETEVSFERTSIRNCGAWGVGLYNSVIALRSSTPTWLLPSDAGNASGVHSSNTQLTLDTYNGRGYSAGYAVYVSGGTLAVTNSQFTGNYYGLWSEDCATCSIQSSVFSGSAESGLAIKGAATVTNCRLESGKNGLQINRTNANLVTLTGTTISNSSQHAVYVVDGSLTVDAVSISRWQLTNNFNAFAGLRSTLMFDGVTLQGNGNAAIHSSSGNLTIRGCTLRRNAYGFVSDHDTAVRVQDSVCSDNTQWGVSVSGPASFSGALINNNRIGGLYLKNVVDGTLQLQMTKLSNNPTYGVFAEACRLTFDAENVAQYSITGSDYQFGGNQSDLTFNGVAVSGGRIAGLVSTGGNLVTLDSTFSGGGYGLMVNRPTSFNATRTVFENNSLYGLYVAGKAQLRDCTVQANSQGGVYLSGCTGSDVTLNNTLITDNKGPAIRADQCLLTIDSNFVNPWRIGNHPSAIYAQQSDLVLDGLTISGCTSYAVQSTRGTLAIRNTSITDNEHGLYSDDATACAFENSTVSANRGYGIVAVGPLSLTNTQVRDNMNGVQLMKTTDAQLTLSNSGISGNSSAGLYLVDATLVFNQARQLACPIERNGSGICVQGGSFTMRDYTLRNNTFGMLAREANVLVERSTFTGNQVGLYGERNRALTVRDTTLERNTSYAAKLYTVAAFSNCVFRNNEGGVFLSQRADGDVRFANCRLTGNTGDAIFAEDSTLSLDSADAANLILSGNARGITGRGGSLTLDGFSLSGNTDYAVSTYGGQLMLKNLSLARNGHGLLLREPLKASVSSVEITGNSGWGLTFYAKAGASPVVLSDTEIANNGSGLYVSDAADGSLSLARTSITGNTTYGLYLNASTFTLADQAANGWRISGNGTGVASEESNLTLSQVAIENSLQYGVHARHGSVSLLETLVTGNGIGVCAYRNDSLAIDRCQIRSSGSGLYGLFADGGSTVVRNTLIAGHQNGACLQASSASDSLQIYNGTVVASKGNGFSLVGGRGTVQNTILCGGGSGDGLSNQGGTLAHSHNLIYGFARPHHLVSADDTEIVKNPRFLDPANGDYRLAVGSPAINAGTDLSAVHQIDLSGAARPTFGAYEIGAFEFDNRNGSVRVLTWAERK